MSNRPQKSKTVMTDKVVAKIEKELQSGNDIELRYDQKKQELKIIRLDKKVV